MLRAFSLFAVFFFLLLAPTAMVAAYAFIAFITRARFGSFVSLVHMLIATRTQPPRAAHDGEDTTTQSASDSGAAAASPLDADARRKLLQLLNICRCPDAILAQVIPAVSSAETSVSPKDVAGVLLPELQSLWMVQIRDTISLSTFHSRWLIAHAAVTLGLLVPLALYFSIGIRIFPSVNTTILVVPYLFFNLPLLAAVLMMALGQFYVDRACNSLCEMLESCSRRAEKAHREYHFAFRHGDSLAATVTFCCLFAQRTFCVGPVQINWQTVLRSAYYLALLVFAIASASLSSFSDIINVKL
jgi:hypothetical protein